MLSENTEELTSKRFFDTVRHEDYPNTLRMPNGPESADTSPAEVKRNKWDSLELGYAVRVKSRNNETVYHGTVQEICRRVKGGFVCEKYDSNGTVVKEVGSQEILVVNYISKTNSQGQLIKEKDTAKFLYSDIAEFLE